jgi:hypothetical protein
MFALKCYICGSVKVLDKGELTTRKDLTAAAVSAGWFSSSDETRTVVTCSQPCLNMIQTTKGTLRKYLPKQYSTVTGRK